MGIFPPPPPPPPLRYVFSRGQQRVDFYRFFSPSFPVIAVFFLLEYDYMFSLLLMQFMGQQCFVWLERCTTEYPNPPHVSPVLHLPQLRMTECGGRGGNTRAAQWLMPTPDVGIKLPLASSAAARSSWRGASTVTSLSRMGERPARLAKPVAQCDRL